MFLHLQFIGREQVIWVSNHISTVTRPYTQKVLKKCPPTDYTYICTYSKNSKLIKKTRMGKQYTCTGQTNALVHTIIPSRLSLQQPMVSCLWRGAANPIKISRSHIKRTSSKFTVNPHALPNLSITPLFDFDFHLCPLHAPQRPLVPSSSHSRRCRCFSAT